MGELQKLLDACKTSYITKAEWTINGKSTGNKPPEYWNFMRIKLKDKQEFLLEKESIKSIKDEWMSLWEKK